jgi:hypothetical protein
MSTIDNQLFGTSDSSSATVSDISSNSFHDLSLQDKNNKLIVLQGKLKNLQDTFLFSEDADKNIESQISILEKKIQMIKSIISSTNNGILSGDGSSSAMSVVGSSISSSSSFRIPTTSGLTMYDNTSDDGLNLFVNQIDNACTTHKISDADKYLVLLSYLPIESEEYIYVKNNCAGKSWEMLKLGFLKQFKNIYLERKSQKLILDFNFGTDEHPDAARIRFNRLLIQGNIALSNPLAILCFIRGIPLELERLLRSIYDLDAPELEWIHLLTSLKRAYTSYNALTDRSKSKEDTSSNLVLAAKVSSSTSSLSSAISKKTKKRNKKSKSKKSSSTNAGSSTSTTSSAGSTSNVNPCIDFFFKKACVRGGSCPFSHEKQDFLNLVSA